MDALNSDFSFGSMSGGLLGGAAGAGAGSAAGGGLLSSIMGGASAAMPLVSAGLGIANGLGLLGGGGESEMPDYSSAQQYDYSTTIITPSSGAFNVGGSASKDIVWIAGGIIVLFLLMKGK